MVGVGIWSLAMLMTKDKTKTIRERTVKIYLPTVEAVGEWKRLAEQEGNSLSGFVIEHVQDSVLQKTEGYQNRASLVAENQKLTEENERMRSRVEMLETVVSRLDEEMKSYRRQPFAEDIAGERVFDKKLLGLFKERNEIAYEELHGLMGIDPRDTTAVKALETQLEALAQYEMVKETRKGWRWLL